MAITAPADVRTSVDLALRGKRRDITGLVFRLALVGTLLLALAILMVFWEHWYSRSFEAHAPAFLDPVVSAGNYVQRPPLRRSHLPRPPRQAPAAVGPFASAALHRDNPFPYALML